MMNLKEMNLNELKELQAQVVEEIKIRCSKDLVVYTHRCKDVYKRQEQSTGRQSRTCMRMVQDTKAFAR